MEATRLTDVPVIDIGSLTATGPEAPDIAARIGQACRELGFFYVVGHGVPEELSLRLARLSRQFVAQDEATKILIRMARRGAATSQSGAS
jgi:isopenicillin N synthase-like dioxygenase